MRPTVGLPRRAPAPVPISPHWGLQRSQPGGGGPHAAAHAKSAICIGSRGGWYAFWAGSAGSQGGPERRGKKGKKCCQKCSARRTFSTGRQVGGRGCAEGALAQFCGTKFGCRLGGEKLCAAAGVVARVWRSRPAAARSRQGARVALWSMAYGKAERVRALGVVG